MKIAPFYDRTWLMSKTLTTVFHNLVEGALLVALLNVWTMWLAFRMSSWMTLFFAGLFAVGLAFTSLTTLFQSLRDAGRQAVPA